jgi:hypothetical protein
MPYVQNIMLGKSKYYANNISTENIVHRKIFQPKRKEVTGEGEMFIMKSFVNFNLSQILFIWRISPQWARASSFTKFLDHTMKHHSRSDSSGRVIDPIQGLLPDNTQHPQETDIHASGGIRTHRLNRRAVADLHLRQRGHWDRLIKYH